MVRQCNGYFVTDPNPDKWDKCVNETIFCRENAENSF